MKTTYFLLLVLISYVFQIEDLRAQEHFNCGSDERTMELINKFPEILQKEQELEIFIQKYNKNKKNNKSGQTYVIPVVFHILHEYGTENISDAQVFDAVRVLNEDFSKTNADTSSVIPDFDTIIGNPNIEFRLAQIDPFGNCTNGIDRIYTHKTNEADDLSKLNIWNRSKYLNIWVVKSIGSSGVAGYAYFPSAVDPLMLAGIDGIVILNNYVGSIGTSNSIRSRALTHEVGHYLNLQHPWGANNDPGIVCGDDGVYDTPETKGFTTCPTNPNNAAICNSSIIENYQNFMDYSYCSRMFTIGQADRIEATLNSSISSRNNLWKHSNLVETGTDVPSSVNNCTPIADFSSNMRLICQGDNITFNDASWKADINAVNWTFNGANPISSTLSSVNVTYNNLYWQDVTLTATGNSGSNTITKQNYVYVSPPWTDYIGAFSESFENSVSNQLWFSITNENNTSKWQVINSVGFTGSKSMYLNAHSEPVYSPTYTPGIGRNDIDGLISPSFDLSLISSGVLTFKYSGATKATALGDITEEFKVYASLNCGKSWLPLKTIQGIALANAGSYSNPYFPTQSSQWETISINLQSILQVSNVRFKFEYKSGAKSNNLFIDDINISGVVGLDDMNMNNSKFSVYPNPFNNNASLVYYLSENQQIKISIYDLLGNEMLIILNEFQVNGLHEITFNKENLSSGIYLLKLKGDNGTVLHKKVIIN